MDYSKLIIIADTREQRNMHITAKLSELGIKFKVKKLDFGDYSFTYDGINYENIAVVERKSHLDELSGNFTVGRERFKNEFIRAFTVKTKVYLLVEDAKGREKLAQRRFEDECKQKGLQYEEKKTYRSKFSGISFINSIVSWKEKYGFEIEFVSKSKSCDLMLQIFEKVVEESSLSFGVGEHNG